MIAYRSADHATRRWLELYEKLGSAKGINPVLSTGRYFARFCESCGSTRRVEKRKDPNTPGRAALYWWACGRCGEDWDVEASFLFRNDIQISHRPSGLGESQAEFILLSGPLGKLTLWQKRLYVLMFMAEGKSYDRGASEANIRWRSRHHWTEDRVRHQVKLSRGRIERGLRWRGVLQRAA